MGQDESTVIKIDSAARTACHKCQTIVDTSVLQAFSTTACPHCGATFTTPGRLGPYVLMSELGLGLMGATYKGFEEALGRYVTIKIMPASLGREPKRLKAFLAEGRALARLDHPNAMRVFSIGQEKRQPYIVMELVNGQSMGLLLSPGEPLDETLVLEIATGVARALRAAGKVGLIHGAVKPDNIILDERSRAKLVNFRIARFGSEKAQTGAVDMPYYVAPEQVGASSSDFRSDIYSLGASMFHGLAGEPPFDGAAESEVLQARLKKPARSLGSFRRGLSPYTIRVVAKMLERDPVRRYQNYDDLLADLGQASLAAGVESALVADADRRPARREVRRGSHGKAVAAGLVAAIGILGVLIWAVFFRGGSVQNPEPIVRRPSPGTDVRLPNSPKGSPLKQLASPTFPSRRLSSNGEIEIVIACSARNADIHYTTDGSEPTRKSWKWNGRLVVEPGATLRARAFRHGWSPSEIARTVIKSIKPSKTPVAVAKPHQTDPRGIPEHRGPIMKWVVAGPYSGRPAPQLFNVAFAPEKNDQSVVWRPLRYRRNHWALDLNATVSKANNCAVYVRTRVYCPAAQKVRLELGSDDAVRVWLNGKHIHGVNAARGLTRWSDVVKTKLSAGWNVLMLKVIDHTGDWGFCCRIRGFDGEPLGGLKIDPR